MNAIPNRECATVAGVGLLLLLVLAACGPKRVDWMDGDRVIGVIRIVPEDEHFKHEYSDLAGQLVRVERRDESDRLLTRFAIVSYAYTAAGELSGVRFSDAEDSLRIGPSGYARLQIERRSSVEGIVEDRIYFGVDDERIRIPEGYARLETTVGSTKPGMRQRFFDVADRAVCATVDGVPDVCEVRFKILQGVTPLTYKMLVAADGTPLRKTRISGLVELNSSTYTTYHSYGDLQYQVREKRTTGN